LQKGVIYGMSRRVMAGNVTADIETPWGFRPGRESAGIRSPQRMDFLRMVTKNSIILISAQTIRIAGLGQTPQV
jgi:hypothetical protein